MAPASPASPEALAREAAELLIRAGPVLESLHTGQYTAAFRGRGLEPLGVRPYVPGDDPRGIDWRATARRGRIHVRETAEERDQPLFIVLDRSASVLETAAGRAHRHLLTVAAAMARVAGRLGDPVGFLGFSSAVEEVLPPARGPGQLRGVLLSLVRPPRRSPPGRAGSDLAGALDQLGRLGLPPSRILLCSDFLVEEGAREALHQAFRGSLGEHAWIPACVHPGEGGGRGGRGLGTLRLRDPETGRPRVVDGAPSRGSAGPPDWLPSLCRERGVDPLLLPLDQDPGAALLRHLARRAREGGVR